ncbi:hypothetical protein [Stutzerimonas urumqiensis]|uniref:hypothetical protein n=1 Tax=Stutzerimonas urumqiensis TaxID=638269 RepID=UPI003BAAEB64
MSFKIATGLALLLASTLSYGAETSATQDCTSDEVDRMAQLLADRVKEISKSQPERAAELNEEMRQQDIKRTQETLGNECEAYRQRIEDIERLEKTAEIPVSERVTPQQ